MNYRILNVNIFRSGTQCVMIRDTNNYAVAVFINRTTI